MRDLSTCPICEGADAFVFLERGSVPVHQNFPHVSRAAALSAPRGDLRLSCCKTCGFVTNLAFDPGLLQYGPGYENDQTYSPMFERYVAGLADRVLERGGRGHLVVEVGCGRGTFLRRLCAGGARGGVGFDPAYVGPDEVDDGRVRFVREYYGAAHAQLEPDLVVCRHVIEHVPEPLELLRAVRAALGRARAPLTAFETPALDWILDNTVVQDFFYEHCSYFTASSLSLAFTRAGFEPLRVERLFGDQYLWLEARPGQGNPPSTPATEIVQSCALYAERVQRRLERLRTNLEQIRATGEIAIWGAGAKGVTYLNLLDSTASLISCVVDMNPRKQGRFVPGTGHPIVSATQLNDLAISNVVVMNPNYIDEIRDELDLLGVQASLHTEGEA
jgi:SAM-dependent methyltransferase